MIFITGCHRSGTSLTTLLIKEVFGGKIHSPGMQMEASLDNPKGFNETIELTRINDLMIQGFGYTWDKPWLQKPSFRSPRLTQSINTFRSFLPHSGSKVWIDKDPRLCLTLDIFSRFFLQDVPTLCVIRNPFAVSRSLALRNGFTLDKGLAIWIVYNYSLLASKNKPLAYIFYEDIANQPCIAARSILNFIDSVLQINPDYENHINRAAICEKTIEDICRQSYCIQLNRADSDENSAESTLSQACSKAWRELKHATHDRSGKEWISLMLKILSPCVMEVLNNYNDIFESADTAIDSFALSIENTDKAETDECLNATISSRENQQLHAEIEDLFSALIRMQAELAETHRQSKKAKARELLCREAALRMMQSHKLQNRLLSRLASDRQSLGMK